MTRSRFELLSKYLHCNDVTQNPPRRTPGHDKLCHIRPVLDYVLNKCVKPHCEQSVDEGMIAYKGRLSFKQLPAKPTKFGIKVWERASPRNGYCHEFQIYTGKVDREKTEEGLGERVVKDLTRKIINKGHHIYMDNFFSSPKLFSSLFKEDLYCCGTIEK
ncbi:piggyBac transposable element-derived protein 2-like, partial [Saccostrea cucullata]|uniref:piggyBac transposable element-derived protein 2-like n=1 Tax=Saccostrea cuccullata TaxID=36930 RepID=UPI002ED3B80B